MQTSGSLSREKAKLHPPSLPATNAERLREGANATKQSIYPLCREVDCFASLAMTRKGHGVLDPPPRRV